MGATGACWALTDEDDTCREHGGEWVYPESGGTLPPRCDARPIPRWLLEKDAFDPYSTGKATP